MNGRHPTEAMAASMNKHQDNPGVSNRPAPDDRLLQGLAEDSVLNLSIAAPPRARRIWKRVFDLAFACAAIVFFSPLLLAIAIGLLVADGRPIFYRQRRIGRNGAMFDCLKFRSMVKDADARLKHMLETSPDSRREWEETHKLSSDPRIHRLGSLLRRTSLDELPQFLNVVKGDMSVVGPRPIVRDEMLRYGRHIGHYTSVRPGLTGLWQVSGRNSVSYAKRVALDVQYVETVSPVLDATIIAKTVMIVVTGTGDH